MEDLLHEERGEPSPDESAGNANVWADRTKNRIQFCYDAEAEWWDASGTRWSIGDPLTFKL
jgi:hypothetical protein